MTRSVKHFVIAVLTIVLALSMTQDAFASVLLTYDNGLIGGYGVDWGQGLGQTGVKFTSTVGAKLLTIQVAVAAGTGCSNPPSPPTSTFTVNVRAADAATPLTTPFSVTVNRYCGTTNDPAKFENIYVSTLGIVLTTSDFFIILAGSGAPARLFFDKSLSSGRSYEHYDGPIDLGTPFGNNLMIRAELVLTTHAPVGGFVQPVNKLTIFAPYLMLFGAIAAVAVVVWKKRDN